MVTFNIAASFTLFPSWACWWTTTTTTTQTITILPFAQSGYRLSLAGFLRNMAVYENIYLEQDPCKGSVPIVLLLYCEYTQYAKLLEISHTSSQILHADSIYIWALLPSACKLPGLRAELWPPCKHKREVKTPNEQPAFSRQPAAASISNRAAQHEPQHCLARCILGNLFLLGGLSYQEPERLFILTMEEREREEQTRRRQRGTERIWLSLLSF